MLRKIEDFQKDWAYEVEATTKLLRALTDESLKQKVNESGRELGFLGWHLTQTLGEMLGHTGLNIDVLATTEGCRPARRRSPMLMKRQQNRFPTSSVKAGATNR